MDAAVMAVVVFLVVGTLGFAMTLGAVVFLGFYWDVMSIWGQGLNRGSVYEALLYLVASLLFALSFYSAYRCAKKIYLRILFHEISLGKSGQSKFR